MMTADLLREAAREMRARAELAATPGPWRLSHVVTPTDDVWAVADSNGVEIDWPSYAADAAHIAGMDPAVALAVADWLDDEAEKIPPHATHAMTSGGLEIPIDAAPAVRVARAYLNRPA